jgi:serine/threonine protein kinase/tetratricopeptide (TPR) repeat protein
MPAWNPRANEIFLAALEIEDPKKRRAHLDVSCSDDAELRQQIEGLLAAHEQAGSFLNQPAVTGAYTPQPDASEVPAAATEQSGEHIGPYKLLQLLGEGGMGSVWVAEQSAPVKRRVALKLIKAGMDSTQVLRRFEAERQALALMDHQHIAKVLDAGTTPQGRPYFAMELIKGIPITRYCDQEHLPPRERLELFVPVCQAVQHAHQKGVIHRDLKPSNVLIALYDGKPISKVIDFGVAKATSQKLTERTMYTEVGQIVGTLEYMAPEQAELNNLDIDTRADIYSLGVILYELLTGSPPFSAKALRSAAFDEMLRMIREVEPQKPSTRLSSSNELPSIAANRKLDPRRLTKLVHGDLDWIVMKALEKDRGRRYETANGFAMDIQRYLAHEPVLAGPPSAGYRFKKFLGRNRAAVFAAGLFLLVLIGGAIGTTMGLVQADRARRQAELRLSQIEKGNDIIAAIFLDLDPHQAERDGDPLQAVLGRRLETAADQLEADAVGEPLVVAKLQDVLGQSLTNLGRYSRARQELERAFETRRALLGAEHLDTIASKFSLAMAHQAAGQIETAIEMYQQVLAVRERLLGSDDPETLTVQGNLGDAYRQSGKFDAALTLLQAALRGREMRLGPTHAHTMTSRNNLAAGYQAAGKLALALPLFEQTLRDRERLLGRQHPDTLFSRANLANAYLDAGQYERATSELQTALHAREAKLGSEHPDTLTSRNNLGAAYQSAGKLPLAIPLFQSTLDARLRVLGSAHQDTLLSQSNLANAYRELGDFDKALPLMRENLQTREKKLGSDNPDTFVSRNDLAVTLLSVGRAGEALPLFEQTVLSRERMLGADHPDTLYSRNNLGMAYYYAGQFEKAIPLLRRTLDERVAKLTANHPDTITSRNNLGITLRDAARLNEAIPLLEQARDEFVRTLPPEHPLTLGTSTHLALAYLMAEKYDSAESTSRELLAIRERKMPDDWTTFLARSLLGGALAGQKKFSDAEPLLLQSFAGMKERQAKIRPLDRKRRLTEAADRLHKLYVAWGKSEEADRWQSVLNEIKSAVPAANP